MNKHMLWIALAALGSALCWWPVTMEPNLDLPSWLPLVFIALWVALATILSVGRWARFVVASAAGTFAGVWAGYVVWWPPDGIPVYVQSVPATVVLDTLLAVLVSLVAALVGRQIAVSNENRRRAVRVALVCCLAFGPVAVALTPQLVAHRVKRNDRLAAERFGSLKKTVELTAAEAADPGRICDGLSLKRNYSGPPFSEADWRRITGNYVRQDGYLFMIYCREQGGYAITASPARGLADGKRRFCTDESRKFACGVEWNRSRHVCVACAK